METVLLVEGRILTGARAVESLLVEDGRVSAAGSESEVRRVRPSGAVTRRLGGRTVIPGLVDAHVHLLDLLLARAGIDVSGAASAEDLARAIAEPRAGPGPIVGRGWDQDRFPGRRYPTAADLDRATGDRPAVLYRRCQHAAVVNSAALVRLGIDERSPDPPGGRIGRGPDGRPNGMLFDRALAPVRALTLRAVAEDAASLARLFADAAALGLTSLGAMSCGMEELAALGRQRDAGQRMPRVRAYLRPELANEVRTWSGRFRRGPVGLAGVKVVADGSFGARTAWLDAPYADAPGESGLPLVGPEELRGVLEATRRARAGAAVHAIGDRALREVLGALREVPQTVPARIEHASLTPPPLLDPLTELRPTLVVQPRFLVSDFWLVDRLGPERARWAYAFRTLWDRGLRLAGSSDAPIEPLDPWTGMRAALRDPGEREALSPSEVLALYTRNGAAALGLPDAGSLEPGSAADLVLLAAPSFEAALASGSGAVAETWIAGSPAFERAGPGRPASA